MGQYLEECIILDLDIELIKTKLMKFNLSILLCYLFFNYSLNIDAQTKSDLIFVDGVCGMCEKIIETDLDLNTLSKHTISETSSMRKIIAQRIG